MNNLARLALQLPALRASHALGWRPPLPLNVVVSASYRCNSRCLTCNVWRPDGAGASGETELTVEEWDQVFDGLGTAPYYLTFSGGEPFLRPDLPRIVVGAYHRCRPAVITIPTNGLMTERVVEGVGAILDGVTGAQVIVNLSLDGLGEEHDRIRGVPGNWDRAMRTLEGLRTYKKRPNFVLGIHSVVSRFNVGRIREIAAGLMALQPDSYITEVAEERVELGTMGAEITPPPAEYAEAARFLIAETAARRVAGFARITQGFRVRYYALAARILAERRQVIPCYAGWASAHIAPTGDVWTCCTRAEPIGNLRQAGYDFGAVWHGAEAKRLRAAIARGECACPMANASYTNMLLHVPTLARVALGTVGG